MNYLLITLLATGVLLLGPVLSYGDPWDDDVKGKGRQPAYDSGDGDPWAGMQKPGAGKAQ